MESKITVRKFTVIAILVAICILFSGCTNVLKTTLGKISGKTERDNSKAEQILEELPHVNCSSYLLGSSYSVFKQKGLSTFSWDCEYPKQRLEEIKVNTQTDREIEYYYIAANDCLGVMGDEIVCIVQYGDPINLYVNDWVTEDEFYENPPRIVADGNNDVFLGWQLDNGYLIINAMRSNSKGEWYNYRCNWVITVKSLEQINVRW